MAYSYSYDRTASSPDSILRLIVQGVLRERPTGSLVQAYVDEITEDLDNPQAETVAEHEEWLESLGILVHPRDVEKAFQETYVHIYTKLVPWADRRMALEVYDYPRGFPKSGVPRIVAETVARELARQDAADARALQELARSRQ